MVVRRMVAQVRRSRLVPLALAAALIGCATPPPPPPQVVGLERAIEPAYVIGPGDNLTIFVYRAPELSVDLPVRPDGRISLPLVPDIEATGRTPTELGKDIEERLKEFLIEPNVSVIVRAFVGPTNRRIRVIGEAAQPKALPFREGLTLLDVLIEVGGLTRYAAGNRADIVRREQDTTPAQIFRVRLTDLLRNGDVSQDVPMRPGDTLIIPQGWF